MHIYNLSVGARHSWRIVFFYWTVLLLVWSLAMKYTSSLFRQITEDIIFISAMFPNNLHQISHLLLHRIMNLYKFSSMCFKKLYLYDWLRIEKYFFSLSCITNKWISFEIVFVITASTQQSRFFCYYIL